MQCSASHSTLHWLLCARTGAAQDANGSVRESRYARAAHDAVRAAARAAAAAGAGAAEGSGGHEAGERRRLRRRAQVHAAPQPLRERLERRRLRRSAQLEDGRRRVYALCPRTYTDTSRTVVLRFRLYTVQCTLIEYSTESGKYYNT